ncbi:MAG: hypothetical protein DI584_10635 [Stenotrophomonas sp.]|uniref:hypothetical protein n=1 Tax=Stenotrophomonas sp. TaxID=69392 RepID=UPI000DB65BBD|nr:hypothetical protein [Stenotrophomonas sp.]PZU26897.1 MAG: hypothetical protein DI584_10635 [Stenotrophomonas sp.]
MTNNKPAAVPKEEETRADGTPDTDAAREQDMKEQTDQNKQEEKLRQSNQIDKGPSACNPSGRR